MTLSQQVIPLPMAQRLKDLGVKQESLFSWFGDLAPRLMDNGKDPATIGPWLFLSTTKPCNNQEADWRIDVNQKTPLAAAFTVAELGEILPGRFYTLKSIDQYDRSQGDWMCISQRIGESRMYSPTEAEARCSLLIHLLENDLITVQEVNSRI